MEHSKVELDLDIKNQKKMIAIYQKIQILKKVTKEKLQKFQKNRLLRKIILGKNLKYKK